MMANRRSTSWWLRAAVGSSKMRTRGLAEREHLRDLDELALRERQRADEPVGPDAADADPLEGLDRGRVARPPRRWRGRASAPRRARGCGRPTGSAAGSAPGRRCRCPSSCAWAGLPMLTALRRRARCVPARRRVVAGEDLQERRLAGAVLAQQPVDGARLDVQVDLVERERAREALGDAPHPEQRAPAPRRDVTP